MVTNKPVPWYKVDNLRRNTNCRVVKPEWVLECVRVGRRINEGAFNMVGPQQVSIIFEIIYNCIILINT